MLLTTDSREGRNDAIMTLGLELALRQHIKGQMLNFE